MTGRQRMAADLADLADLSLDVLPAMFDPGTGLFSHKTTVRDGEHVNREPNLLYSTVSLVGLLTQRRRPADDVVSVGTALDGLHRAVEGGAAPAELANLTWACTLAGDARGERVLERLAGLDPRSCPSGELGQALYGLVVGAGAHVPGRDRAMAAARACAEELLARFRPGADVFRASPRRRLPRRGLVESRFASFAAQVYPLHGLTALCLATGEDPPPAVARVAARIVEAQGPLGQWWWLYSTRSRVVIEGYPVYSVHQDGMAFLGLTELRRLGLDDFSEPLAKGLNWLSGANELGADLVDRDPPLINRCIQRAGSDADRAYGISAANFRQVIARSFVQRAAGDRTGADPARLEILRECRSYHLGWLLYADSLVEAATAPGGGA
jgi:hypothetical protein